MIQKAAYGSMMLERYLLLGFFCGLFVLLGFFVLFLSSTLETAASKFKKEICLILSVESSLNLGCQQCVSRKATLQKS